MEPNNPKKIFLGKKRVKYFDGNNDCTHIYKKEDIHKDLFYNLKCDYFLEKVFNNLEIKKSLNIVKYNKNIKKRINININDYKNYLENYSSIEIEIKPLNNKYGKFINIVDKDKLYYHIYFDDNKKEIKRNNIFENEKIKKIIVKINYQIKSFENLFLNNCILEQIYIKKYNKNITNMIGMFYGCSSLKKIIFCNKNNDNDTDMSYMFAECQSLKELNLDNFNTDNVTDMNHMFSGCSSLTNIDLSKFNTDKVTDMLYMFSGCKSLKIIM